jgi:2-methylaconitate isomerase
MQVRIPASWMRGGTSKGVFFLRDHLPPDGAARNAILLRALGGPDPFRRQIDGLGSGTPDTSKAVIVGRSSRPDCDVDCMCAQVSVDAAIVDYSEDCSNLAAAVGPFAIQEGLVAGTGAVTTVRIWQQNTGSRIVAHVPTDAGEPLVEGEFSMEGVPRPGAEIRLDFAGPGQGTLSCTARLLMRGAVTVPPSVVGNALVPSGNAFPKSSGQPAVHIVSSQVPVRAVIMRGGTSRGVFFRAQDLPGPGDLRDRVILSAFGSPDPSGNQIDGLGGAMSTTSKVVIVGPSSEPGCDVDYFFGQVDIKRPLVDYTGSCGNLSSAVGPLAIEEGLVSATGTSTTVRIWQVNTRKRIVAHIPTAGGLPAVDGSFMIDGVPFPGARIQLDNLDPGGSLTSGFLPTGREVDVLDIPRLGKIEVTLVDASNPVVIVRARDLGLRGDELGEDVDSQPELLKTIEAIRGHGAVAMGLAASPEEATHRRPGTPKIAFVAGPRTYRTQTGKTVDGREITLLSRIMTMGTLHRAHAATGAVAVAAAALVRGSIAHSAARLDGDAPEQEVRIGHPSGVLPVGARVTFDGGRWTCEKGITYRTARRLMEGWALVPASVFAGTLAAEPRSGT